MNELCLITGGSGYFGSLLLRRLLARGYDCRVLDIRDAEDRPKGVEFVQADIRDSRAVERACEGVTLLFHNVAQVPLAKNRDLFRSVNVEGTEITLQAAARTRVRKVVHTSSSAIYGAPASNPVTESTPAGPCEPYGVAKHEAEQVCARFVERGLDVSIIRPRTVLGHGRLGIFQILFEWIREGYNIPVLGRGDNVYQFVHADDLAEACILAAMRAGPGSYNCGAERYGSMREVLEQLCRHAGTGSRVRSVPMGPAVWGMKLTDALGLSPLGAYHALMYGRSMYFDITKARGELGWQPGYSNEEMFVESYEWYVAHRDEVMMHDGASHHRSPVKQGVLKAVKWLL